MAEIDFKEAYDSYVKGHQKVWAHDRSKSMGASEAFGCLRKAWFSKNGGEIDPDYKESWGALQRGDLIEQHFAEPAVKWFLENYFYDTRLIWGGDEQVTMKAPDAPLTATPDGLVIDADDDALALYGIPSLGGTGCFNFEIKSIDPRVNLREEKSIHRGQTIVQMGITRETTEYRPNYAVIVYIDASFFDDIEVFVVAFDQQTYDVAKQRARSVFEIKNVADIFPEGKVDNGCDYCKFKRACAKASGKATPTEGEANMTNTALPIMQEFEDILREERVAAAARKASEAEYKSASERLKQWFRDVGVRRAEIPGVAKVSISWIKGRKSYDIEAMREAGLPVEDFTKMSEGHDRLTISEKGPKNSDEE
jgi:CRISPR/Cas system-associated exonuclease Cas4 (RecB family)